MIVTITLWNISQNLEFINMRLTQYDPDLESIRIHVNVVISCCMKFTMHFKFTFCADGPKDIQRGIRHRCQRLTT